MLPLAVHMVNGYRILPNLLASHIAAEQLARVQVEELRPYIQPSGGLVFSSDYSSMVRLRQRLDVEPLIYGLLCAPVRWILNLFVGIWFAVLSQPSS